MFENKRIGVIGAGVMGQAMINGLLHSGQIQFTQVWASVKSESSQMKLSESSGFPVYTDFSGEIAKTDIFLVCTKPRYVSGVLDVLKASGNLKPGCLIISIAAGITIARMKEHLGSEVALIRAMPNTPCKINEGITVISPAPGVSIEHKAIANSIFSSVGKALELDETHLDAVTAVSGSGPAYIFLIMEALADGAVRVGLPRDVALQLVSQTVLGSAKMLQLAGKHPASLKDDVTTPAGSTIAALLTMEDGKIRSVLARAVEEATRTARGLGNS